ncbi:hypothetical protein HG535_0C02660 [Zygotorulaspora mrakii]|uniref:Phosphoglycerate mutase n=1 Tax=Zygotorulaspora mrakii TaxID=42260 RepID=A0A7H9B0M7_ZYGMR|nr:uncharacterized protein HG535_0C02660 [Zygotorulaspora mrakii]QLG71914.1 hypothetical protein HG535_0C02660 [Zygotorulaspora mrakii]
MTLTNNTFKVILLRHGQSELNHENIFCGWIDAQLTEKGKHQARHAADLIKDYCEEKNVPLPQIGFTSRLVRTEQTMEVMLDELHLKGSFQIIAGLDCKIEDEFKKDSVKVLQTWRLNERHYGSWQGQRKPDILKEYGKEKYMYIRRDYQGKPPSADLKREMIQEVDDQGSSTGYDFKEPNRRLKYGLEEEAGDILPDSESLCDVVKRLEPFLENVVLKLSRDYNLDSCLMVGHGSSVRSILKVLQKISDDDIKNVDIPNATPLVVELEKGTFKFINRYYLDPETAKIDAQKVRQEGFQNNP